MTRLDLPAALAFARDLPRIALVLVPLGVALVCVWLCARAYDYHLARLGRRAQSAPQRALAALPAVRWDPKARRA